jgi:hypothetical protein
MPARGSISGTAQGHLLTPAIASDRSIRSVGPQIEFGAPVRRIDGAVWQADALDRAGPFVSLSPPEWPRKA